jgi:hypothetical protein
MGRTILGISAFYHDSAAALVQGGEIIAASQEERFSRVKHDPRFPVHAINSCLEEAFISASDLDAVIFYDNPLATFDRIVTNSLVAGAAGREQFLKAGVSQLGSKIWVEEHVTRAIGSVGRDGQVLFARSDSDARRRRGMGHDDTGHGTRPGDRTVRGDRLPALAGTPLQCVHLVLRLQGQFRRVQVDGPRTLRGTAILRRHSRASHRPA